MELAILIITLIILSETSILILKSRKHPLITTNQKRKVYIDTSALMDPRLIEVAKTGFIGDDIVIPRSVTNELQLLADGKDSEKRLRARAGLDTVRELERVVFFNTTILNDELDHTPVDNRLMELAKANHGLILTNDFNLSKVAATEHIDTLNLNALALTLRNQYLPGERAKVKIVAAGSNPHQGVAYLRDGTMVVVDHASEKLGQEVEVEFIRLNQTASGTMLFARLPVQNQNQNQTRKTPPKTQTIPQTATPRIATLQTIAPPATPRKPPPVVLKNPPTISKTPPRNSRSLLPSQNPVPVSQSFLPVTTTTEAAKPRSTAVRP